jgi:hypothetical protein
MVMCVQALAGGLGGKQKPPLQARVYCDQFAFSTLFNVAASSA